MLGMDFLACIVLFVIAIVVSAILFYALGIRIGEGIKGFIAEIFVGWIGAWLGWIWCHWWFTLWDVYVVPAIIGSVAVIWIVATLYPPKAEIK
jgi:uncharacterized membrane protein YeaQ/YmgE (transglycosylase-associated protein family)